MSTTRSVVYFSRSGVSRRVAEDLAAQLNCAATEIIDQVDWSGVIGYLRGMIYGATDRNVEITFDEACLSADEVILVAPLWTKGPAPAARAFLRIAQECRIRLVLTNHGSPIDRARAAAQRQYPQIVSTHGITQRLGNHDQVIADLITELA